MPTQTFYNLSKEKQQRLMQAVREEFERVPFEQVSINRIVQTAGISRGSFYQYFDDKDDLFYYCIQGSLKLFRDFAETTLKQCHGDLFATAELVLVQLLETGEKIGMALMKNFMKQMHGSTDQRLRLETYIHHGGPKQFPFYDLIDRSLLNLQRPEDLEHILDILVNEIRWCIVKAYLFSNTPEEVKIEFHNRLQILRRGMASQTEDPHVI